jgi:hypothetical protein
VHLEVAAISCPGRRAATRQEFLNGGSTEEVLPERAQPGDGLTLPCRLDRVLDERRFAVVNQPRARP